MAGPSLKSVARAAGVSVSSVSNAYNKPEQLSTEVRDRILAVAREQGYVGPDAAARSLRSKRAGAIGLLFTERLSYAFSDPYSVGMLAGIAEIAEQYRSGLLLIPLGHTETDDPEGIQASIEAARQANVDGAVAYCVDADHPAREVMRSRGLPIVASTLVGSDDGKSVTIDEAAATRQVGALVRRLGHRRVGIVLDSSHPTGDVATVGDDLDGIYEDARLRAQGWLEGLGDDAVVTIVTGGHNAVESGRAAGEFLLDRSDRPTAILCVSDVLALGVLEAMRPRRLVAGRDVSVTGFDDIPAAEAAGLTTVRQPVGEKGRLMARMLLDPTFTEEHVVLPTELVVRASTGPAPKS